MPAFTSEQAKIERAKRVNYPKTKHEEQPDPYAYRTLRRTRRQIVLLYRMLKAEQDPAKIDRIASAIEKLSRIEQNLAGRPGPGQYRPVAQPTKRRSGPVEPLPPQ